MILTQSINHLSSNMQAKKEIIFEDEPRRGEGSPTRAKEREKQRVDEYLIQTTANLVNDQCNQGSRLNPEEFPMRTKEIESGIIYLEFQDFGPGK